MQSVAKILLVEDHADSARSLARLLRSLGYEVRNADGYRSAMAAAAAERFDLLLCDIGLPDGNGCDLLRELRASCGLDGIAVSGHVRPEDINRSQKAGFLIHLTKPVVFEQLKSAVEDAVQRRLGGLHKVGWHGAISTGW
jgi:two-component system CheB/CheR fusion protein